MKHTRLDSLLLAGVGTLAVHEVAYVPGSVRTAFGGDGVSHAHLPLLWGIGGTLAIAILVRYVVSALQGRAGARSIDPLWLGGTMAALFVSQEAAELAMAGSPSIALLGKPTLWLGLVAVPLLALLLAFVVNGVAELVSSARRTQQAGPRTARVPALLTAWPLPALALLTHSLSRRGPPVATGS